MNASPAAVHAAEHAQRILLVEDNPADAEFVELSLEEVPGREFDVTHVPDLRAALAALERASFDALLLDIGLPDADVGEGLAALQAAAPYLPVIVLSGMENERVALDCIEQGAQDYLVKGHVEPGRLVRVLDYSMRRKSAVHALKQLAQHDPLTGLFNRRMFEAQLERALARARRSRQRLAVLYLDVDGFKPVNDTFGHAAGDELLRRLAERLRSLLRETDTLARLGGDEFAVVLENQDPNEAPATVAEKVVAALAEPFRVGDAPVQVGASVGVAVFPDVAGEPAELIRCADAAMYRAKRNGRNRVELYVAETAVEEPPPLDGRLAAALEKAELRLIYQPQVAVADGRTCGAEALLRWQRDDDRGALRPQSFLAAAERSGLIAPIGEWVLQQACRQVAAWRARGHELQVTVNVSVHQLDETRFPALVQRVLQANSLPPAALELDIAEAGLLRQPDRHVGALERLVTLGVRVAVDDFGAGYAALNLLQFLPLHTVKLDHAYVHAVEQPRGGAAVRAVVGFAHALGLTVAAESVETAPQLRALARLGVDRVQGHLLAPPAEDAGEPPRGVLPEGWAAR